MTVRQQWGLVAAIVGLLALGLLGATRFLGDQIFPVSVGTEAPDFRASTIDTTPHLKTLADYKGQVVVLNVWATWCDPCRVEMPSLEQLSQEFAAKGLHVVGISVDNPGQDEAIRDFVASYGLTFEVLHDGSGAIERAYQTTGVPETFVIGRDGRIRKKVIGAARWDSEGNQALIAQLLAE